MRTRVRAGDFSLRWKFSSRTRERKEEIKREENREIWGREREKKEKVGEGDESDHERERSEAREK